LGLINDEFIVTASTVKPLLHMWPVNRSDPIQNFKFVIPGKANALAITSNGRFLAAGVKENVYIWHVPTGKMLAMLSKHYQSVNCLKFNKEASHLVSGGEDGRAIVWSLAGAIGDRHRVDSTEPFHIFSDHALPVTDMWIGYGLATLVTASKDRTCKIYDIASKTMLMSLVFQEMITAIAVNRSERNIYIGTNLGNVYYHCLQAAHRTREYHITEKDQVNNKFSGHSKAVTCLAISVDQQTLMSGSEDMNVITWNVPSRSILKTTPHKGVITNLIFILRPRDLFERELKLQPICADFQRMISNPDTDDGITYVMHTHDMCSFEDNSNNYEPKIFEPIRCHTSGSVDSSTISALRLENETLKRKNKEMFDLLAKKLMKEDVACE
jgi:pre-rRNA-processing protein IPI3